MKQRINVLVIVLLMMLPILTSCAETLPEESSIKKNSNQEGSDKGVKLNLGDNIRAIDLNLPENSEYLQYQPTFENEEIKEDYPISGNRKIVHDTDTGSLYLKQPSGEKKLLLQGSHEGDMTGWKGVRFFKMIDDHRFFYDITGYECQYGFGVYDINTGEDHYIDNTGIGNEGWSLVRVREDRVLLACLPYGGSLFGFGEFNLNTYTFMETDNLASLSEAGIKVEHHIGSLSPDGNRVAFIGKPTGSGSDFEYRVLIYSLAEKKVLNSYTIYYAQYVVYHTDKQVYAFAEWWDEDKGDKGYNNWLYIIDLP